MLLPSMYSVDNTGLKCVYLEKSKLSIAIPSNKTKRLKQSKGQRMSYIVALKKPRVIGALAVLHPDIS